MGPSTEGYLARSFQYILLQRFRMHQTITAMPQSLSNPQTLAISRCGPLGKLTYTQALELMPLPGGHTTCRS